jgi:hypothetical protein
MTKGGPFATGGTVPDVATTGGWARRVRALFAATAGRARTRRTTPAPGAPTTPTAVRHVALPDHEGPVVAEYSPALDGDADPGEIVWTWVPYEDDPTQGKDRPVLVVGRDGARLLALMLTSKDHDRNAVSEAHHGRYWLDIGAGAWDTRRRPSEVRLDRVLRVDPATVRREGAIVDRATFEQVVTAMAEVLDR